MNLFADETQEYLKIVLGEDSWSEKLSHYINTDTLKLLSNRLNQERNTKIIYPNKEDVFKIFRLCPFNKVKVVIVGQDPYHNGNADGIAFSCKEKMSSSLRQILIAINNDIKSNEPLKRSELQHLDYLVEQGVFLYNTILTVEQSKPLSHKGLGWEHFTDAVFKALATKKDLIWLAWGQEAQQRIEGKIGSNQVVLKASHPASAAYNNSIWKCDHFSIVNNLLKEQGIEPINWLK